MSSESFKAASKAAESWISTVALVAKLGEGGSVDAAYRLLLPPADDPTGPSLLNSFNQHGSALGARFGDLAALADAPVTWEHGRGLSAIAGSPEHVYPHVWSSAHEAAHGIARLALELLAHPLEGIADAKEQGAVAHQLLADRWRAISMPLDEVAALQERIRREREKLAAAQRVHDNGEQPEDDPWLPAESPGACAKRIKRNISTLKRYIERGNVRCLKVGPRLWRLNREDVKALGGRID